MSSRQPDVLVVGGGVIGASVAFHLARRGARVLVLDDGARGSTPRATGGQRAQFDTEIDVRLSLLSRAAFARFRDETGVDPGLLPHGYLFIARSPAELDALRAAREVQRRAGFTDAEELDARGVLERNPALAPEGILGGMFAASDGFLSPPEIRRGYAEAAARLGADFQRGTCVGLTVEGGRIVAAETSLGRLEPGQVVNAAGAWAGQLGIAIPVTPLRRQVAATKPTGDLPAETPMTIFVADGFHFRVRDGRVLLLAPSPPAADPWDTSVDPEWLTWIAGIARARVPTLRAPIDPQASWAGLYEMSPDGHALLGRAPGLSNLVLANGSSGHGVMHSPALGQLAAEIVLDGAARSLDISALSPERPLPEVHADTSAGAFFRGLAGGTHQTQR